MALKFKQSESNIHFLQTESKIAQLVSKVELDNLIDRTIEDMKKVLIGVRFGLAWSGGKDSVAVDLVLRKGFGQYPSAIGMTHDLEYPEFMRFVTNNMPDDFKVYNSGHTMQWLADHDDWLFPSEARIANKWFEAVQRKAQIKFKRDKKLDYVVTGRRLLDRNNCGRDGILRNKTTGLVTYSPIKDWSHEHVLAAMHYYNLPRAPFYSWPNGYVVGSGCWAARQWTGNRKRAWDEVYRIDPTVVKRASKYIKSADEYVRHMGI